MVTSQIQLMKYGKQVQEADYKSNRRKLLESVSMLFSRMHIEDDENIFASGPGAVFGLVNPEFFIKPPPPDFLEGLSKEDFSTTFGKYHGLATFCH